MGVTGQTSWKRLRGTPTECENNNIMDHREIERTKDIGWMEPAQYTVEW